MEYIYKKFTKKCINDHISLISFYKGVPVNNNLCLVFKLTNTKNL
jgi:hypothetical protein